MITNMEYTNICTHELSPGSCRQRSRCTSSKKRSRTCKQPARTIQCCLPRTLIQRTHFHETWRDSRLLFSFVLVILLAILPGSTAQGYLPSYSEYTSHFEWHNPNSLDPEGLNVCVRDRLSPALEVLPRRKILKDCEKMDVFAATTCRAFRDKFIHINDLYVHVNVVECCDGWLQSHTSCTQRCPMGTYGPGCRLTCQCGGQIQMGCHHITGECFCATGRTGKVCETTCAVAKNAYGPSCSMRCPYCRNGGVCDPISGECLCQRGFTGRNCYYRTRNPVQFNCARCMNDAACDQEFGMCLCNPGWRGRYCTQPCPIGTFGSHCSQICTCLNNGICLPEDGSCVCPTGWIGAHCETACPESYWGDACEMRCDCPDGRCDPFTGECRCPRGRLGPSCIDECAPGFYGRRCTKKCNCPQHYDCDAFSGKCYLVRPIITTTASPTTTINITTTMPTTRAPTTVPTTPTTDPTSDEEENTFFRFPLSTTPNPITERPSRVKTQVVLGTSLGGVLVLAVLLTIAFIWIVFQRRDTTKCAKPIDLKHQNRNNNSEVPLSPNSSTSTPPSTISGSTSDDTDRILQPPNSVDKEHILKPPNFPKPKLPLRRLPQAPEILQKPIKILSMKFSKKTRRMSPVYECADNLTTGPDVEEKSQSLHSYCDPKTSFNNPFYDGKKRGPSVRSVPGSVRRFAPSPFTRAATVHSSRKDKSLLGSTYEVPQYEEEYELAPRRTSRREQLRIAPGPSPPGTMGPGMHQGYLQLSGEMRDPANLYIGLMK